MNENPNVPQNSSAPKTGDNQTTNRTPKSDYVWLAIVILPVLIFGGYGLWKYQISPFLEKLAIERREQDRAARAVTKTAEELVPAEVEYIDYNKNKFQLRRGKVYEKFSVLDTNDIVPEESKAVVSETINELKKNFSSATDAVGADYTGMKNGEEFYLLIVKYNPPEFARGECQRIGAYLKSRPQQFDVLPGAGTPAYDMGFNHDYCFATAIHKRC